MKKFGMLLMLLSLVTFNVGCGGSAPDAPAETDAKETGAKETGDADKETSTENPAEDEKPAEEDRKDGE